MDSQAKQAALKTPSQILPHANQYSENAWMQYTPMELGTWIHLLVKRAGMRVDPGKKAKDLEDAQNYLHMLQAHIDAVK